jgi:hypothetical protein
MKRFYTFEPKNFRIFDKMKGFIAVALLMLMALGNVDAQVFRLVSSASDLNVGDTVIIAAKGYDYALSTDQQSNNRRQAAITKTDDKVTLTSDVEIIVLEAGNVTGTFALKAQGTAGYLYASSSTNNRLGTQSTLNGNASWLITISSGTASIVAQGSNTRNTMQYNSTSGLFSCYASASQSALCLYKKVCAEVETLTVTPDITSAQATWSSEATSFVAELNGTPVTNFTQNGNNWTCDLASLTPNTDYTFKVRSACQTEFEVANFTTGCTVYTDNTVNATIYEGQVYPFHGTDYTEANTYTIPMTDAYGCDSTITLVLEVLPPLNVHEEDITACDSYTLEKLDGTEIICTETNIYYDTLVGGAQGGLDSIHIVNLTIGQTYNIDTVITICETDLPFNFGPFNFPEGSQAMEMPIPLHYTFTTAAGCDSVVTLRLTIGEVYEVDVDSTICENALPFTWNGVTFTAAGTQSTTLQTVLGCDSVVNMTVNVNTNTVSEINAEVVENDLPYELNGTEYTTTGTYTQLLENANGCDSTITLNLTVYMNVTGDAEQTICESQLPYVWNEVEFTAAGTQSALLVGQGSHGEDSTVNMTLVVNPEYTVTDELAVCDNELPYTWNEVVFTEAGTQTATLQTVAGCDSVVTMTLTVNPTATGAEEFTICPADLPYTWNDTTFGTETTPGTYTYIYNGHTVAGCDSVVTLTLTINANTEETVEVTVLENELPYEFNGDLYSTPGTYYTHIQNAVGCDSAITLVFDYYPNITVDVDSTICSTMLPLTWNEVEFDAAGNGTVTLTGAGSHGEDSTVNMTLNVLEAPVAEITYTICDSELPYTQNGVTFDAAGAQDVVLTAANGCDSTLTMTVVVNPTYNETEELFLCPIELPYTWNDTTFEAGTTVAGQTYTHVFNGTTVAGCDSVVELTLTMKQQSECEFEVTATAGAHGTISPAGTQTVDYHATPAYTITPDACYEIATLTVNGVAVDNPTNDYTLEPVEENTTVDVTFQLINYELTWTNIGNGDGTVNDSVEGVFATALCGDMVQGYVVKAATGSHLTKVVWNNYPIVIGGNIDEWTINIPMTVDATNINIQVEFTLDQFTVTATENDNTMGIVDPSTAIINYNESANIDIASETPGYHIEKVVCGNDTVLYGTNADTLLTYTVQYVTSDTLVEAFFAINNYNITVESYTNGTIEPAETITVEFGTDTTFTFTPDACYHVEEVLVDGVAIDPAPTSYDFVNVADNHTLAVTFAIDSFLMVATVNDASMGEVTEGIAACGSTFEYVVTAYNGYHVDHIERDGAVIATYTNQPATASCFISNVTADTQIDVFFAINEYEVTATATNGTIAPATSTVAHGGSQTFTMTPDECYELASVTVNGVDMTGDVTTTASDYVVVLNEDFAAAVGNPNSELTVGNILPGWTGTKAYPNEGMLKFGTSTLGGAITLPTLDLSTGDFHIEFDAAAYNNSSEQTTLILTVNGVETEVDGLLRGDNNMQTFSYDFTNGTANTVISFESFQDNRSRFFLDNVKITTGSPAISTLTVTPIEGPTTVEATFSQQQFEVVTSVIEGNGEITPTTTFDCGSDVEVTMTAGDGYHINYYVVNGETTTLNTNDDTQVTIAVNSSRNDTVDVAFAINTYNITACTGTNGTLTVLNATVNHGDSAYVQVVADVANGYHIVEITDNAGGSLPLGQNTDTDVMYGLGEIQQDIEVCATFAHNLYPITVVNNNPEIGTIVPSVDSSWTWGEDVPFVITPSSECYYISEITVDGTTLTAGTDYTITGDTYTFVNVVDEHSITVGFDTVVYQMTATIDPASSATVTTGEANCGQNWDFVMEAAEGQHLAMIFVDYVLDTVFTNQEDTYTYTVEDVHGDHNVIVYTAIDEYAVNVTTIGEGVTNIDGDTTAVYNTTIDFTFAPNACNELVSFTINDVEYIDSLSSLAYTWTATEDAIMVVTYDSIRYIMAETHTGNGTVSFDSTVNCGETYTYEVQAEEGWHIESCILSDGVTDVEQMTLPTTNADNATTVDVTADKDYVLNVTFAINTYNVTLCNPLTEGTATINPAVVAHDSTVEVTVVVTAPGYHVQTIFSDEANVQTYGENDHTNVTYTLANVVSDTCVDVTFELNNYNIVASVSDPDNGEIVPEGDSAVRYGDNVTYTIRPTNDCHYISTVVVDDTTVIDVNDSVAFDYTFAAIDNNHTIVANFDIYRYEVTTSVNDATMGTITATDSVDCGSAFDYEVTPEVGYHIASVEVDGVPETIADSSTFTSSITDIHADHSIVATFEINHYLIDVTAGANGTIVSGDTVLEHGQDVTFTITPDDCYYISELIVDGEDQASMIVPEGMTYTFANVSEAHTIEANFEIYTYDMTETHTGNGTVSTADDINCGDEYTYTITADMGWHIASIEFGGNTINNTMVEPNDFNDTIITINPVRQDTILTVVFEIDHYTVSACAAVNGTITINDPVEVDSNMSTTATIVADTLNGYHIVEVSDNRGGYVAYGNNTDVEVVYNIDNVDQDIEVCAVFALNEFHITATAGANGTIDPEGTDTLFYGETLTYTITADQPCYYISAVDVDGESVWTGYTDSISPYTYTFTAADFDQAVVEHTINAEFTMFEYNMTATAHEDTMGTVTSAVVNCGDDYTYEITANYGWHIDHVVLDGTTTNYDGQPTEDEITVTDIHEHHNLDVYFARNYYPVTAIANEHGSIVVAGTTSVEHGTGVSYEITPDHCYYISEILVNGEAQAIDNIEGETFAIASIEDTTVIEASFEIYRYFMGETHTGNGTVTTDTVDCDAAYQYTITADTGWHIESHTLGGVTYTLNHNSDVQALRNVTAATQDTTLEVIFARNNYTIDVTVNGNGTTTPGDTTVEYEATVDYTITADFGHHIASVTVDGVAENVPANADTYDYTFSNIDANHTLNVVFEPNVYVINATAEDHGTILLEGDNEVVFGGSVTFSITADPCYNISAILVDGEADTNFVAGVPTAEYTMSNIDSNHTVVAQFETTTYEVTVNVTGNGTADPTSGTYNCGDTVAFTFTPDNDGVEVESVVVNGNNIGSVTSYVINGISADYTIDVTFADITYTLTSVAYNNGTIDPVGDTVVAYNGSMTYTLTPDECQTVSELLVNGVSYLDSANFDGTTLTLDNIQRDMTIQAYFQVMTYTVEATQADGGVITETGVYNCGTDVTYNITANDCYTLTTITVDGEDITCELTDTVIVFNAIDTNHTITATFTMNTYTITANVNDDAAGTITPTDTFNCGETPVYEITPNEGYYIVSVMVDSVEQGAIDSYTFSALHADHTIDATFAKYTYTVSAYGAAGVEITPEGDTTVEYGESVSYTLTADDCYEIVSVMLDGEDLGAVTTVDVDSITANHVITVESAIKTYTITATATEGGNISPVGEVIVNCGASQFFSITPAEGYVIESVEVDGADQGAISSYLFDSVTADATIHVIFSAIADSTYTITATAGANGTITPAGDVTVNYGASQTFVIVADEYYTIGEVLIDSVPLANPVASYTFVNVTANHTIDVTFVPAECPVPTYAWTTDITDNSATLNWTDMEVTSYTIRYKSAEDTVYTEVTGITETSYELSGLDDNMVYVWNVKSVCIADTAESSWSSQQQFRTEGTLPDTTGVANYSLDNVKVYSYGNDIYVVNNSNVIINNVQVYDLNGRIIYNGKAQDNPTVINVNAANGMYVVRVTTADAVRNYKVSISQR